MMTEVTSIRFRKHHPAAAPYDGIWRRDPIVLTFADFANDAALSFVRWWECASMDSETSAGKDEHVVSQLGARSRQKQRGQRKSLRPTSDLRASA
jgi:hypothetical protein